MFKVIHFHCKKSADLFAKDVILHESEYVKRHPCCLVVDPNNWKHSSLLEMAEMSARVYKISDFCPD